MYSYYVTKNDKTLTIHPLCICRDDYSMSIETIECMFLGATCFELSTAHLYFQLQCSVLTLS